MKSVKNVFADSQDKVVAQCSSKVLQNAPREHSAILSTCIKRLPVVKTNLSSFEWLIKTDLTVIHVFICNLCCFLRTIPRRGVYKCT